MPLRQPATAAHEEALDAFVGHARMRPYRRATVDDAEALRLYLWNIKFSAALMEMIAVVEVAMRNSMTLALDGLAIKIGKKNWFDLYGLFDERTTEQVQDAIEEAMAKVSKTAHLPPGQVTASMRFGSWVGMLGKGGFRTDSNGDRVAVDYEENLWRPALSKAFANGGTRKPVEDAARKVNGIRNRISHHEPMHYRVPLRGQTQAQHQVRRSPSQARKDILHLAWFIDSDLAGWLSQADSAQAAITELATFSGVPR